MANQNDLLEQADLYMSVFDLVPNPTPAVILDGFCEALQSTGRDLGEYSEDLWFEAFERLGYPPERGMVLMERVASWGVTDVDTFIDPASLKLITEARKAGR
jgi:hypothetical protein